MSDQREESRSVEAKFSRWWSRRCREREERRESSRAVKKILLSRGRPVFEQYGLHKVYLFGSVTQGRWLEGSDVDLLVMPLASDRYWDFRHDLEEALDLPVDLYTQADEGRLVERIMATGEIVYAARL
ncbi:MAG: nucleotidyltransferase domain-containing protein [Thermodesulfobacteriota bacterium]